VGPAKPAEEPRHELTPAGDAASVPLGVGLPDQGLELGPGKKLEELAEQAAEWAHG
jgi:hypothetical protein